MANLRSLLVMFGSGLLLVSCASERKVTYSKGSSQSGLSRYESDVKFVKGKDGGIRPNKDKRSQFDGRSEYLGNRDFRGKGFAKKEYGRGQWEGSRTFKRGKYDGRTDGSRFQYSPEFVQQQARVQGQVARMSGREYGTDSYGAGAAREAEGAKRMARPADAETNVRRRVYKQPIVIDKDDYAGMSVRDSKRLLGR